MQKTGEAYTSARAAVVRKGSSQDYAAIAGMSDQAVQLKTGRDWNGWVTALDDARATSKPHKEIARLLRETLDVTAWWAQTITVGYERIRGLRDKGQVRGGAYQVSKSKTFPVSITTLYAAFAARQRRRWLEDVEPVVSKATREKSIRFVWDGDTRVDVYFWEKGPHKSQVQIQHRLLPDKQAADQARGLWAERLAALDGVLRE